MPSAPRSRPDAGPLAGAAVSPTLLLTRPEEDCRELAEAGRALGFEALVAPLLAIEPLVPPDFTASADALLLTSARAARLAVQAWGERVTGLPVYAVGPASARAAEAAGLRLAAFGDRDASAILALAAREGNRRILHPCGWDQAPLVVPEGVVVERLPLYAARPRPLAEEVQEALRDGRIFAVLLFSPRTARLFRVAVDAAGIGPGAISIVAISEAAAVAAGTGWRRLEVATDPRSDAILAAAYGMWQEADRHG